jgi:hypothetical protein
MITHRQLYASLVAAAITGCLATPANAVTYDWVFDDPTLAGYLRSNFTVPDAAVADGIITVSEFSAFDLRTVDGVAGAPAGSFSLDPDFNVSGGSLFAQIIGFADGLYIYDANLFSDHLTLSSPANVPFADGRWVYREPPVVPPSHVPDATSGAGALSLSLLLLFSLHRRSRRLERISSAASPLL